MLKRFQNLFLSKTIAASGCLLINWQNNSGERCLKENYDYCTQNKPEKHFFSFLVIHFCGRHIDQSRGVISTKAVKPKTKKRLNSYVRCKSKIKWF